MGVDKFYLYTSVFEHLLECLTSWQCPLYLFSFSMVQTSHLLMIHSFTICLQPFYRLHKERKEKKSLQLGCRQIVVVREDNYLLIYYSILELLGVEYYTVLHQILQHFYYNIREVFRIWTGKEDSLDYQLLNKLKNKNHNL